MFFLMIRPPPRFTRTDTLFPYTTLFRSFSSRVTEDKMTISKGDRLPSTTFVKMTENGPEQVQSDDFFKGRKVALFSVPGAFTPTCSAKHLPGYRSEEHTSELQSLMRISYAVFCLKTNNTTQTHNQS